ncbi:class II glutamine amidotransferase [Vibrio ostreicida]|uniref:Class II glutamine amidotransferase n=1 Tax=Vibrio ostreicida TaxID=526588 RepID=A0ABT8C2F9_9VIBR|nr:class II glutamine amidotransferase [Vibrio ostreicida]MDN3612550.1 class II glutamine amidotransferase [Vibrio ostreicida]NPD09171.1 class II glutamine amidotransferase [Vibrio ostreicida]
MCRWLAYQGDPIYLDELVYEPEHSLVHQSLDARKAVTRVNADGFGLGWYNDRQTPGQFHEVLPAWGDDNLRSLAHHIRSHRFMAHVRSSTGTQVARSNCHPFIIDHWMFLHNGQIGGFEQIKFALQQQLPEALFLKRMGTTDSELIFLMMLNNGLQQDPVKAIAKTLTELCQRMIQAGIVEPLKASICISDGHRFWVVRYSSDNDAPTVFIRQHGSNITLASEPLEKSRDWKKVAAQTILAIDGATVTSHSL